MNILSVDFQGTNARGMDGMPARFINTPNGKRRVTAGPLIKALTMFMQERNAKAFDAGLQVAKSRIADNAIAAALLASNRTSQQLNARAIDHLFDTPAPAGATNLPLLDVLDGIIPEQPQSLDDVLDGIQKHTGPALSLDQAIDDAAPQPRVSITKFINDI